MTRVSFPTSAPSRPPWQGTWGPGFPAPDTWEGLRVELGGLSVRPRLDTRSVQMSSGQEEGEHGAPGGRGRVGGHQGGATRGRSRAWRTRPRLWGTGAGGPTRAGKDGKARPLEPGGAQLPHVTQDFLSRPRKRALGVSPTPAGARGPPWLGAPAGTQQLLSPEAAPFCHLLMLLLVTFYK